MRVWRQESSSKRRKRQRRKRRRKKRRSRKRRIEKEVRETEMQKKEKGVNRSREGEEGGRYRRKGGESRE